jgi:hypothetical protein
MHSQLSRIMPTADTINYIPRRAALPDKPRQVNVTVTRTADNLWHTCMPVEDLDYLIALEFERQRQLRDIADHNDEDASELARHSLFIEGGGRVPAPKVSLSANPNSKPNQERQIHETHIQIQQAI